MRSRFATALLVLTSSPLSFSSAFTPRAFGGLSTLHSSLQSQSQSQCHSTSTNWHLLRGGSSSSSSVLSMSTTAEAPTKTGANMSAGDKLDALRSRMKELDLDVYLVPSDDPHLSGTWSGVKLSCFYCYSIVVRVRSISLEHSPSSCSPFTQSPHFIFTEYVPTRLRAFSHGFS
jgi:hypothetical protein